ncbi:SDR family NAD(P)-dependent oxidoreductase [Mesorhizobium sp. YC-39]|uniref:SDR family NAD(P)-dependent oxidoreductase n=1 Tax=unclassified Mesorhizobium TaxID=325217 RepID=UPI0021E780B3|nr:MULTISPECIES: SDR family NAD(P)-dependent oxidoreductase [unclassified Mesorhizobium]MCV3206569.1 SDR family NAD(P)-dependent oxidoreductase [Mesorhizobium sp. YC-2]MCV3227031.1 SDR family NAD(P)-dependent oxidoreductase [Mesorhizobium sp. YC-39]
MADASASPEMLDPTGRVVMLSGASRGIGLAIARRLHAQGYTLSLGVRNPDAAVFAAFDPARTLVQRFDAEQAETAAQWVDATVARFGRIDALINNAGILRPLDLRSGDESVLDEMWAVNVKAPFRLIRLALPHLEKGGHGRIINVASTDGKRYRDTVSVAYAMTKHAVMALTHAAKFAGWEKGVRVTALCPGAVDTDLVASVPGVTPSANRIAPETIAETVAFLLRLPNTASVAELVLNTRLESWI